MPQHQYVTPADAAKPVGPYSPAVAYEQLVFVSGQGARVPAINQLAGDDIEAQTEQCLVNVRTILEAAGSNLSQVLKCSVFLADMSHFARMNAVYERMFAGHKPARTTVQAVLPMKDLLVEIDCIAYR
jgi:2-iminobutanoate/2-iminopropanoate deaminase